MDPFILSIILYISIMFVATVGIDKIYRQTKLGFFVSNRCAPDWQVAFSAAASWMYVLVIVMTAQFTVNKGPGGVFWFLFPSVLTIMYFGLLGHQLLTKMPQGFTFSEFIAHRYNNDKLTRFYQLLHIAAAIYAIAANLTGFGMITEYVSSDFGYPLIVGILGCTILSYSLWGGVKASLRTDTIQMILVLFVAIVFSAVAVAHVGGIDLVYNNWSMARPTSIFSTEFILDPGILLCLLFMGSIMADNGAYQKIYSLGTKEKIVKTYLTAGVILMVAYAGLTILSASIFSLPIAITEPRLASIQVTEHVIGYVGVVMFVLMVLAKASSASDTALNSAGSVVANDFFPYWDQLTVSRITMVMMMSIGVALAALKIDLWILITTFGVFRLLAVMPTLYALFSDRIIKTDLVFWSMLITGAGGLVITLGKIPIDKLVLSTVMLAIPGLAISYQTFRKPALNA